jgi:hypothetical protein
VLGPCHLSGDEVCAQGGSSLAKEKEYERRNAMKFYSITYCDYEGMNRYELFSNKREAMKKHTELKREESTGDLDAWVTYVSGIKTHELDKLNKKTVIKMFKEI